MNNTITVKAAPGTRVPKEGKFREYISDDLKGIAVADTSYYRRLIRDTSLKLIEPETKPRQAAASAKKEA